MARKKRNAYGHGSVRKPKGRDTWTIQWRDEFGKRKTEAGFKTELKARQRLGEIKADIGTIKFNPGEMTLNDLAKPWLDERDNTHKAAYDDRKRWELHIAGSIGECKPNDVTPASLKTFILAKRKHVAPGTVKLIFLLLSSLFSDLIESGHAAGNPCRGISKKTRALMKSGHDPKNTPFLHEITDVIRLYQALRAKEPVVGTAYAIGALGGLRTGEVRALDWSHVDMKGGMIHVQVQVGPDGPRQLKDGESRLLPIQPSLAPVLDAWARSEGQTGLVCKPIRGGARKFLDDHTMGKYLAEQLKVLGLAAACSCCGVAGAWYEFTRHTYGSQFIMAGGSMEELSRSLGHSTIAITQAHYVHLRPGYYSITGRNRITADFGAAAPGTAAEGPKTSARKLAAEMADREIVSARIGTDPVQTADNMADEADLNGQKVGLKMVK